MEKRVQSKDRTAVILAAGFGSRLAGTVESTSIKPLTPVAGVPLIFRTINTLSRTGHSRVVIVLGHKNEEIEQAVNQRYADEIEIQFTYNSKYHLKNGVSVLAARKYLSNVFTLTMSDHILDDQMVQMAAQHQPVKSGATLLVDYKLDTIFDIDDATKVKSRNNKIVNIGKEIDDYNCVDTGLFVCTRGLTDALQEIYSFRGDVSLSEGVKKLASQGLMHTLDIRDGFWQDIDTSEMLDYAEKKIMEWDASNSESAVV